MTEHQIANITHRPLVRRLPTITEPACNWYQGWYFDLRLEEEVARSIRYQLPLSLLVFFLTEPSEGKDDGRLLNELLSDIAMRKLRRMDIPAVLGDGEYAVSLPHTNLKQAEVVARRLAKWFKPFSVAYGIVSYPEDGQEPGHLLLAAEHRALASSEAASATAQAARKRRLKRL